MTIPALARGVVFGADFDDTYSFWRESPKWKRCVAFCLEPPTSESDAVPFFLATTNTARFEEHPTLTHECVIFAADSYSFFPLRTAIDMTELCVVPLSHLMAKNLRVLGHLSSVDIARCVEQASRARLISHHEKQLLGFAGRRVVPGLS